MSTRLVSAVSNLALVTGLALLAACNHLQAPRFTSPTEQGPVIPLSVKLVFDESVRSATLEQTVCADLLWKGRLGDAIVQSFSETGRARLAHLSVGDPSGTAQPTTAHASEFMAFITLASASFTPTSRSGSDDINYLAQFDVRLVATFQDAQGHRFPEAPMVYSNRVALWTPQVGGSDNQCATGQLDAAVRTAADHLANQLMEYLTQVQGEDAWGRPSGPAESRFGPSLLALKATLLDANNNLVLENGEKIGVRIDVTNTGKATLGMTAIPSQGRPHSLMPSRARCRRRYGCRSPAGRNKEHSPVGNSAGECRRISWRAHRDRHAVWNGKRCTNNTNPHRSHGLSRHASVVRVFVRHTASLDYRRGRP